MTDNGQVDTATATRAAGEKPWLHPDALTPRDYLRAKTALEAVLDGRSPYELLTGEEMYPFLIWALRSREDPTFTWEQALDTPFWHFRMGDEPPPPPTPPPGEPGSAPPSPAASDSTPKQQQPTRARSSSATSG